MIRNFYYLYKISLVILLSFNTTLYIYFSRITNLSNYIVLLVTNLLTLLTYSLSQQKKKYAKKFLPYCLLSLDLRRIIWAIIDFPLSTHLLRQKLLDQLHPSIQVFIWFQILTHVLKRQRFSSFSEISNAALVK